MFKVAHVGKIVGVPTAGGVIGTQDITLSDGSRFRIPTVGFWGMDGTPLEGLGIVPDFVVEETAEDRLEGRDPQLDKAIEVVLDQVKAKAAPAKPAEPAKPVTPEPPVKPLPKDPQAAADIFHPLRDAKAGEWVLYRTTKEMGVESTFRVTVSEVKNGTVRFDTKIEAGGDPMLPLPADAFADVNVLRWVEQMGKVVGHRVVSGKLGGTAVEFLQVDFQWTDGSVITLSFSDALPAYGLHRVAMGKVVLMEAAEWMAVAKPEAPPAAAPAKPAAPRHPVFDAKVGEWVKVKTLDQGREIEMTLTVREVTDTEVVLATKRSIPGREIDGPEIRRARDEFLLAPNGFTLAGYSRETLTVNARDLNCVVMTATAEDGATWKWWVSDEIPVNGYVRVMRGDLVLSDLLDWGFPAAG
jgi:hypothetical protein